MSSQPSPDDPEDHGFLHSFKGRLRRVKDSIKPPSPSSGHTSFLSPSNSSFRLLSRSRPTTPTPGTKLLPSVDDSKIDPSPKPASEGATPGTSTSTTKEDENSRNIPWRRLTSSLRSLENVTELFPPLKSAVSVVIECLDIFQVAASNREEYELLAAELGSIIDVLNEYADDLDSEANNGSVANISRCIQDEVADIKGRKARGELGHLRDASREEEDVIRRYKRVESLFRRLQCDVTLRTRSDVKKQLEMTLLRGISPVDDARYNSSYSTTIKRHGCTAETREHIQHVLQKWAIDPTGKKIYWMNGMAGTGKTTIAYSLCKWLEDTNRLGASFFCSRTSLACRSLSRVVPTLAYQLARYSPAFRATLVTALKENPDSGTLNVGQQFEQIIYQPALKAQSAIPDSVVVVIDALDECDDSYSVHLLLEVILKHAEQLPLKFFVASRPEHVIRERMLAKEGASRSIVHLHDIEQSIVEGDIRKYLTDALSSMAPPPSPEQIQILAKRAGKLFIYAATVVRYVHPRIISVDSRGRLEAMLAEIGDPKSDDDNIYEDLDRLYTTVLNAVFGQHLRPREKDCIRYVLWTIVCAKEPISSATITWLTSSTERKVLSALESLRSVLHIPEENGLISTLHASFPEYMLDRSRSKDLYCDESQCNGVLAQRCFDVMRSGLQFNICNLPSSFLNDTQVVDMEARVAKYISRTLSYACRYWGRHLRLSPLSPSGINMLLHFLSIKLLFWVEVLNFTESIRVGAPMLHQVQTWLSRVDSEQDEIQKKVADARNFVTWFAANPCSRSTPHIYISALPLCAKSSWVYQHYMPRTQGLANVAVSQIDEAVLAIWNTESTANSVAISPDGDYIATGSDDASVQVYDRHTGAIVIGPLKKHSELVYSVAFSPDGTHLVSGSCDNTIIIWDTHTGNLVTGPLKEHKSYVWSVAFSPDGNWIVSGSNDKTVIVWNRYTGEIVAGPLRGHTEGIASVDFSPDSRFVASSSLDSTIRLWDASTGADITNPLHGHKEAIYKIAFSPDGSQLGSCSADGTIRMWDTKNGAVTGLFIDSQEFKIDSIAFSCDGTKIASSETRKFTGGTRVMVRDIGTGSVVVGPLHGHTGIIRSLVFSPDNTHVISCSDDKTIRIWDVQSKNNTLGRTNAREVSVGPVAFSFDYSHLISRSSSGVLRVWNTSAATPISHLLAEKTELESVHSIAIPSRGGVTHVATGTSDFSIRIWSVPTGEAICSPLKGHTDSVGCLAFSPDGAYLCCGSDDSTIIVWDTATGNMVGQPFKGHEGPVHSVVYSPDGTHIASGGKDQTVRVWDPTTGALIHTMSGHEGPVLFVVFSPDGSRIASGGDRVMVYKWNGHIPSDPVSLGVRNQVSHVCFSPNGAHIVAASGSTIQILDTTSLKLINTLRLPASETVGWVGYTPDGNNIFSVSTVEENINQETTEESTQQLAQNPNIIRVWRSNSSPGQVDQSSDTSSDTSLDTGYWSYEPDGRIICPEGFVMWVSPDLVSYLKDMSVSHRNPFISSADGIIDLGYKDLCIGERWAECYIHKD